MGLASAWRGELWQALRVSPAPPKSAMTSAHWGNLQNEMEPQIADERHEKGCVCIYIYIWYVYIYIYICKYAHVCNLEKLI